MSNNTSWFKLPSFLRKQSKSATTMQAAPQDMSNEKAIPTTFVSWTPKLPSKKSNTSLNEAASAIHTTHTTSPVPHHPLEVSDLAEQHTNSIDSCIHNKDIVPLRQFLRYSMNRSDQRNFQRRRLMHPATPKYEIEWQKNQWLLLDDSTNKQIEHLCKNGFTKIAIRKDTCLKKHISYNNPSDIDVLLELSFGICDKSTTISQDDEQQHEPIVCHQPRKFSVRRTQWWRTTYHVAEAHLPDWVDPDLCCDAVMMDAPSVLAAMTDNYSRSSLSSSVHYQPKMPDTPIVSQKSSFLHLHQHQQLEDQWSYKPLQYSNPPFLMDKPALVIG
ncbi:G protein subunit beta [Mucor velutinosus]|uniref:G protein subunit beta n=1 Tax=Mucor velutinosus TaxID=708070 RepID=A0AAN7HW76_9FUNG|nr:G protein subunit beta [Mucor velutinosus]